MITKRIIPCLDVKDGRVVKGVNFAGLQDMADPVEMARYYNAAGADELVFYDITASVEGRTRVDGKFKLFTKGGRENTGIDALNWLEHGVKNGAGELVVNSIDTDGVKNGFDLELLDAVAQRCAVPIIASGGAGKMDDFKELFLNHPRVDAGLAASIFHTKQVDIRDLKLYLRENGVEMRV